MEWFIPSWGVFSKEKHSDARVIKDLDLFLLWSQTWAHNVCAIRTVLTLRHNTVQLL